MDVRYIRLEQEQIERPGGTASWSRTSSRPPEVPDWAHGRATAPSPVWRRRAWSIPRTRCRQGSGPPRWPARVRSWRCRRSPLLRRRCVSGSGGARAMCRRPRAAHQQGQRSAALQVPGEQRRPRLPPPPSGRRRWRRRRRNPAAGQRRTALSVESRQGLACDEVVTAAYLGPVARARNHGTGLIRYRREGRGPQTPARPATPLLRG